MAEQSSLPSPPTGTVAFLFTDIEDSVGGWERHPEAMAAAIARHDALLREVIAEYHVRLQDGRRCLLCRLSCGRAASFHNGAESKAAARDARAGRRRP